MTGSTSDAQTVLREKLKIALQDVRKLYDDGLVDENEFKDLKAHELSKYKEQLTSLISVEGSTAMETTPTSTPAAAISTTAGVNSTAATAGAITTAATAAAPVQGSELQLLKAELALTTPGKPSLPPTQRGTTPPLVMVPTSHIATGSTTPVVTGVVTPMSTPRPTKMRVLYRSSPAGRLSFGQPTSPRSAPPRMRSRTRELVHLPPSSYQRLTTPPIFRRRPAHKRRIVITQADLDAITAVRNGDNPPPS